jgi:hypothetical protein
MAVLINGLQFTGSLGNIIGYTREGSDKNFIRNKSNLPKDKIKHDPSMELVRQNATEFSGCGKAAGIIRRAMMPLIHLRAPGFNLAATGTRIAKVIQLLDEEGERGKREILFSRHKHYLEGLNLNPQYPFSNIVTPPIVCEINRQTADAYIELPALTNGINLFLPWQNPIFRLVLHLSVIDDVKRGMLEYEVTPKIKLPYAGAVHTPWQYASEPYAGEQLTIELQKKEYLQPSHTLLLSAGIEMGLPVSNHVIIPEKKKGSAKVLKTA